MRADISAHPDAERVVTEIVDDGLYDLGFVCAYFGGNKPLHPATIYRGIDDGRYPRPVRPSPNVNRWVGKELLAAKQAIIDAPRRPLPSPRNRRVYQGFDVGVSRETGGRAA